MPEHPGTGEDAPLDVRRMWRLLGGARGVTESVLPPIVFVAAQLASGSVLLASGVTLGVVVVFGASRFVWRGDRSTAGLWSGAVLAGLSAILAALTGRAGDNFLPGILANAVVAVVLLVSLAVRRPLVWVLSGMLRPEIGGASARRAGAAATWVWVGVMAIRLGVEVPLYAASVRSGDVLWLGGARVALGVPLFALGAIATWALLRPVALAGRS